MNWYLQQKEAWNWKSMLPGGGTQAPGPIAPNRTPSPAQQPQRSQGRSRQAIDADKSKVMMQINQLKGPMAGTPGAKEKIVQLQQQYQQLLNEGSLLHEMNYDTAFAPTAAK